MSLGYVRPRSTLVQQVSLELLPMPMAVWVLLVLCVCLPRPGHVFPSTRPVPGLQRRQSVLGFPTDGGRPHTL